jgi:hypothetical protein
MTFEQRVDAVIAADPYYITRDAYDAALRLPRGTPNRRQIVADAGAAFRAARYAYRASDAYRS